MKKLFPAILLAAGVMTGCSSVETEKEKNPVQIHEVGDKSSATAVIVFDYMNTTGDAGMKEHKLKYYLSSLPQQSKFQLCGENEEKTGCLSNISAWQNQLRNNQDDKLWITWDLHFLINKNEKHGVSLPRTGGSISKTELKWGESKQVAKKSVTVDQQTNSEVLVNVTAYKL